MPITFPEDAPEGSPPHELLVKLFELYKRAGHPGTRTIAKGLTFSHSVVHNVFTNKRSLRNRPVLLAVVKKLASMAPLTDVDATLREFDALWETLDRVEYPALSPAATTPYGVPAPPHDVSEGPAGLGQVLDAASVVDMSQEMNDQPEADDAGEGSKNGAKNDGEGRVHGTSLTDSGAAEGSSGALPATSDDV